MKEKCNGWVCPNCGRTVWTDHCPDCLSGIHMEDEEGIECGGVMEPVGVWVKTDGKWEIIQRCQLCGEMSTTKMTSNDNYMKIWSIASKPLASPPFPIEKTEELTKIMGGSGSIKWRKTE